MKKAFLSQLFTICVLASPNMIKNNGEIGGTTVPPKTGGPTLQNPTAPQIIIAGR